MTILLNLGSPEANQPLRTRKEPPNTNKTKCQRQPIGMVFVTHGILCALGCLECTGFPRECLFFVQLEQKPSGSVFNGLTGWNASNKKHVVPSVVSTLDKSTPSKSLRGNDVSPCYRRDTAHNQYRYVGINHVSSGHSARAPPANQSVRVPSFFVQ